ncbi:MAG: hypothetical protein R3346_01315 [Candidatus Spechtbacterales bacterium]|nr:hypothetical protein [Candidatus Spechtbacterales bacterium]
MSENRVVYFAHPINTYDTPLEEEMLDLIREKLPDWEIENPNKPEHEEGYQRYKRETGNGMAYFTKEVLPKCSVAVFLAFRDRKIPAGVVKEILFFLERGKMVYQVTPEGHFFSNLSVSQDDILSVSETRARLRDDEGNMLPY